MNTEQCKTRSFHIDLNSVELKCYPVLSLDKCNGSCNTSKISVPNKTENVNLSVFHLITTYISCKCKWKFDSKENNSNQIWNNNKFRYECKSSIKNVCEKSNIWNPATCSCENGKYLGSIIDNSVVSGEIIETTKNILTKTAPTKGIPTNSNEKK